jgi:hypothetical protein
MLSIAPLRDHGASGCEDGVRTGSGSRRSMHSPTLRQKLSWITSRVDAASAGTDPWRFGIAARPGHRPRPSQLHRQWLAPGADPRGCARQRRPRADPPSQRIRSPRYRLVGLTRPAGKCVMTSDSRRRAHPRRVRPTIPRLTPASSRHQSPHVISSDTHAWEHHLRRRLSPQVTGRTTATQALVMSRRWTHEPGVFRSLVSRSLYLLTHPAQVAWREACWHVQPTGSWFTSNNIND